MSKRQLHEDKVAEFQELFCISMCVCVCISLLGWQNGGRWQIAGVLDGTHTHADKQRTCTQTELHVCTPTHLTFKMYMVNTHNIFISDYIITAQPVHCHCSQCFYKWHSEWPEAVPMPWGKKAALNVRNAYTWQDIQILSNQTESFPYTGKGIYYPR